MNHKVSGVCFAGALFALATVGSTQAPGSGPATVAGRAAGRALAEAGCAQHRCGATLGAQFDHADLVFEGIVRGVESRLSDPSADGKAPRLPVTYVTFDIVEVFWGLAPQQDAGSITIRILGGPAPDGRILSVSGRPVFGVGQRDILMVRRNHRGVASVLHGSSRRFRVRGEELYNESGRELVASPHGELRPGAAHDIPELRVRIGNQEVAQVVHDDEREQSLADAKGLHRLGATDLRTLLRLMAKGAAPEKFQRTQLVGDVAMSDRFVIAQGRKRQAAADEDPVAEMPESEHVERAAEQGK